MIVTGSTASACIVSTYAEASADRDINPLGGQQGEVVERADARRRRRDGEREVPDALEQKVRADRKVEREGVLADHVVHGHVGEPHRRRRAEDGHEPRPAAERPEPVHEVRRRAREAGVPARRESRRVARQAKRSARSGSRAAKATSTTPRAAPEESATLVRSIGPPWPMASAPKRIHAERMTPSSSRSAKSVPAVTKTGPGRSRSASMRRRSPPRAGRMLVRAAAHRDGREQLPEAEPVTRALEEIAPADGHDDDVRDNQGDRRDHRPRGQRHDLAPGLALRPTSRRKSQRNAPVAADPTAMRARLRRHLPMAVSMRPMLRRTRNGTRFSGRREVAIGLGVYASTSSRAQARRARPRPRRGERGARRRVRAAPRDPRRAEAPGEPAFGTGASWPC